MGNRKRWVMLAIGLVFAWVLFQLGIRETALKRFAFRAGV